VAASRRVCLDKTRWTTGDGFSWTRELCLITAKDTQRGDAAYVSVSVESHSAEAVLAAIPVAFPVSHPLWRLLRSATTFSAKMAAVEVRRQYMPVLGGYPEFIYIGFSGMASVEDIERNNACLMQVISRIA